jgi:hypothetical protein
MTNDEQPTAQTAEATPKRTPVKRAKPLSPNDPASYKGGRYLSRGAMCGWCLDSFHETCVHEIAFFDKLHVCMCDCNKEWIPQDFGSGELKHEPKPVSKPVVTDENKDEETPEPQEEPVPEPETKRKPIKRKTSTSH